MGKGRIFWLVKVFDWLSDCLGDFLFGRVVRVVDCFRVGCQSSRLSYVNCQSGRLCQGWFSEWQIVLGRVVRVA